MQPVRTSAASHDGMRLDQDTEQRAPIGWGDPARSAPAALARMMAFGTVHRCAADGGFSHSAISQPGDPHEREADRIADGVMRSLATAGGVQDRGTSSAPDALAAPVTHRSADTTAGRPSASGAVARPGRSAGRPLDRSTRAVFEPRLGAGLGHVRVHSGADASAAARQISAHAFTIGSDIVFGAGQYAPGTAAGQRLLAHELAHVVHHPTAPGLHRQALPLEPPVMPPEFTPMPEFAPLPELAPLPEIGPIPEIGPMPEVGPAPQIGPAPGPMPGPFPGPLPPPLIGPSPHPDNPAPTIGESPTDLAPEPDLGPAPAPHPQPKPAEEEEDKKEPDCKDPKWLTQVTWAVGPQGQANKVTAEPLTRCPGNTVGSMADERVYQAQFDCIRQVGQRRIFHPLHVLHGLTRRTGLKNLHGPGNQAWNLIIGSGSLNGLVYNGAEWEAIDLIHNAGRALWYEASVDAYVPGNEFFASSMSINYGWFNVDTRARGPRIGGGTFAETRPAPVCAPSAPVAGLPAMTTLPPAADFVSTLKICMEEKGVPPVPHQRRRGHGVDSRRLGGVRGSEILSDGRLFDHPVEGQLLLAGRRFRNAGDTQRPLGLGQLAAPGPGNVLRADQAGHPLVLLVADRERRMLPRRRHRREDLLGASSDARGIDARVIVCKPFACFAFRLVSAGAVRHPARAARPRRRPAHPPPTAR